ncbi:MAG: hypothetical protein R6V07_20465 [Armatimonadota bacterium]
MSDWLKKANKVLGDIAGQAGRQAEIVQLQAKLGSLENKLDEVYVEAGKRAEELLVARQIQDDELRVILERARQIKDETMEVRQQVQDLRQAPEPADSEGEKAAVSEPPKPATAPEEAEASQEQEAPAQEEEASQAPTPPPRPTAEEAVGERACPACGGEVTTHMVFCPHCGEEQDG